MDRTQHKSNNDVLGAPAGWDQKQLPCNAMPINRGEYEGHKVVVSFWRPTKEELALLNAGALVSLWIIGTTMPPAKIAVEEE